MRRAASVIIIAPFCVLLGLAGCKAVESTQDEDLVVEAFIEAGQALPPVVVRASTDLHGQAAVQRMIDDASVEAVLGEQRIPYQSDGGGSYRPALGLEPAVGDEIEVIVDRGDRRASGRTVLPPLITIERFDVTVPDEPEEAVLLDSLNLSPNDSAKGFLYLIQVDIWWQPAEWPDSHVRAQLKTDTEVASRVIDLFLRSDEIFVESEAADDTEGLKRWTGIYGVQVDSKESPLPRHRLRISLLRGGTDYARFAWSRTDPTRREPQGNVAGGIGIVAGVAVDSLSVDVTP